MKMTDEDKLAVNLDRVTQRQGTRLICPICGKPKGTLVKIDASNGSLYVHRKCWEKKGSR